jgi:hypothetical protein
MLVTGTIRSHDAWGTCVALPDFEFVGASIDLIQLRNEPGVQHLADNLPSVGATLQFRVFEVRKHHYEPWIWIRLTAAD